MGNWAGRSAADIAAAVREKRVTPREVVAEHLTRIERYDGRIEAFRTVRAHAALAEADEVGARADLTELPLAGVPVAVKDNLAVRGEAHRDGSAATPDTRAAEDHVTVARLRAAGAVVVGLTNVPELCVFGTTEGPYGASRNPWDTTRTAGGSSGGSAAAVAAGFVPIALGNDGMGSLRIPAANCGLVTLKPGSGVVPAGIGNGDWFGMSENGPLATTVADLRLMLGVLAGQDFPAAEEPARRTIAVALRNPLPVAGVGRPYASAVRQAAGALARAGHRVRRAEPPYPLTMGVSALNTGRRGRRWTPRAWIRRGWPGAPGCTRRSVGASSARSAPAPNASACAPGWPPSSPSTMCCSPRPWPAAPPPPGPGTNAAGCAMSSPTRPTRRSPRPGT